MNSTAEITSDPLLFDKLLEPIEASLRQLDGQPLSLSAKKLRFRLFVRLLLCASLRPDREFGDARARLENQACGTPLRLSCVWTDNHSRCFSALPARLVRPVDASFARRKRAPGHPGTGSLRATLVRGFLLVANLSRSRLVARAGVCGVRLHLGLSLNLLCPAAFILSGSDKKV